MRRLFFYFLPGISCIPLENLILYYQKYYPFFPFCPGDADRRCPYAPRSFLCLRPVIPTAGASAVRSPHFGRSPAGFGKTAAVRHALRALPSEAVHWHTALSDSGEDSFFWLARQLAALDPALDLTLFSSRHVQTAARLSALRSAAPLYLVLDNVPSQEAPWTVSLFHTLAQRPAGGLHIILISRHFSILPGTWKELGSFCSICREDLGLHSGDIAAFARTFDLELSPARAAEPEENTGGWLCSTA